MKGQKSGKIVLWIFSVMFILGSLGGFSSGQVIAGIALMLRVIIMPTDMETG